MLFRASSRLDVCATCDVRGVCCLAKRGRGEDSKIQAFFCEFLMVSEHVFRSITRTFAGLPGMGDCRSSDGKLTQNVLLF